MDAVLSALVTKLPELGIAGLALWLLLAAWRNAASDRADYRDALKAAEDRHAAELARVNREHDEELAEVHKTKDALRRRIEDLNASVDLEREARRKAEDRASEALRRLGGGT